MMCYDTGVYTNAGGEPVAWYVLVVFVLIRTLSLICNVIILVAVVKHRKKGRISQDLRPSTAFAANVSCCAIVSVTFALYYFITKYICRISTIVGKLYLPCMLRFAGMIATHYVDCYLNIVIAGDRYRAIVHSTTYRSCIFFTHYKLILVIVWLISIAEALTVLFWNNWSDGEECDEQKVLPQLFIIVTVTFMDVFTVIVIGVIHWKIYKVTRTIRQRYTNCSVTTLNTSAGQTLLSVVPIYVITEGPFNFMYMIEYLGVSMPPDVLIHCSLFRGLVYLLIPLKYSWYNLAVKEALIDFLPFLNINSNRKRRLKTIAIPLSTL